MPALLFLFIYILLVLSALLFLFIYILLVLPALLFLFIYILLVLQALLFLFIYILLVLHALPFDQALMMHVNNTKFTSHRFEEKKQSTKHDVNVM